MAKMDFELRILDLEERVELLEKPESDSGSSGLADGTENVGFLELARHAKEEFDVSAKTAGWALFAFQPIAAKLKFDDIVTHIWMNASDPGSPREPVDDLPWKEFYASLLEMLEQYEAEKGREHPVTIGEMYRSIASAGDRHLRNRAGYIQSPFGDDQCSTLGAVLSSVFGMMYKLASYYGCRRGPRVEWSEDGEKPGWLHTPEE